MEIVLRKIKPNDNDAIGSIVRNVLTEFNCNRPGTAFADPQTNYMYQYYAQSGHAYFIVLVDGVIAGGAGIGVLQDVKQICELQKMYLSPAYRNLGLASKLLTACINTAIELGYTSIYLETMPELKRAIAFYKQKHFETLAAPLAHTGHNACSIWMLRTLT